jgi:hypothetical protein
MLDTTVATQRTVKVGKRNGLRLELSGGRWIGAASVGLGSFAMSYHIRQRSSVAIRGYKHVALSETSRRVVLQIVPCDEQKATD